MSGGLEAARVDVQAGILKRFGEAYDRAEKSGTYGNLSTDPLTRRLAAARAALEYAVIKTALEKNVATPVVGNALHAARPDQQAMMIKEGRAAMERAYGNPPEVILGALAGKMIEVPMPKGFASNPEFDKLIDSSRNLVTAIVQETYSTRGKFAQLGTRDDYITLGADNTTSGTRAELAGRLAFIDSAIDASVTRGQMTQGAADMLKERVEAFVFQPRPPQSLEYTPAFKSFYQSKGQEIRGEVMKEVRTVTAGKTLADIGNKLDKTLKAFEQPIRKIESLER